MKETSKKKGLSNARLERYGRQLILPEMGEAGQLKLMRSGVIIIGCGGLGSVNALYLAGAGVGRIGLVDGDRVELNNLHRQIIFSAGDIGKKKSESAKKKLKVRNTDVEVKSYPVRVNSKNIRGIIEDYDFVIDCTDNFSSHYLVNDACALSGKPFSHAGVLGFRGQAMTVIPRKSPCYRCVFHDPPEDGKVATCLDSGVLGTVPGLFGAIQATEAIKYIIGKGELLTGKLFSIDLLQMKPRVINIKRNRKCHVCGRNAVKSL